ncbi:MAG TPA: hypothetical protein VIK52_03785 [Opitutaceae bacterium]
MATPILMLALMVGPWLFLQTVKLIRRRDSTVETRSAAATGLFLLFAFTAIGHFAQTESMSQMFPDWVPAKVTLVYLSGVVEFLLAVGFLWPASRRAAGWAAISLLVLFFPLNVYAAIVHAPIGGHAWGPIYLLVRGPLQVAILVWVYWFTIRGRSGARSMRVAS